MSKEAMKLALMELHKKERHRTLAETRYWCDQYALLAKQAIEALAEQPAQDDPDLQDKDPELVEQPAQHEPFTHYRHYDNGLQDWADEKTIPLYTSPPAQQEPVAWVCYGAPGKRDIDFEEADINRLPIGTQLYTSPPAQRTWVGLTIGEIQDLIQFKEHSPFALAEDIEAKLKEKNNG